MTGRSVIIGLVGALLAGGGGVAFATQVGTQSRTDWRSPDQQGLRATAALNLLEAKGDGQFSNFSRSGRDFTAVVTKEGKTMQVLIKPDSRQIVQMSQTG